MGCGLRRWLLASSFVLFTVLGVAMAISGEGMDRVVGAITVLLFGFGGAGWWAAQRRRPGAAVAVADVGHRGHPIRAVVVPARPGKFLPLTIGAIGMGLGCLLMGIFAETLADAGRSPLFLRIVGFGGGGFFLVTGAVSLAGAIRESPKLALLPEGVVMTAGVGRSFVPWDIVSDVGVHELGPRGGTQRFAGLRTTDRSRIEMPRWSRWLSIGNRRLSGWDLTYAESTFDLSADELARLLAMFADHPEVRRSASSLAPTEYSFDELVEQLERRAR